MKLRNKQIILMGAILMIIATISFIYWGQQKQVWFCDEIYTYESANGFEQNWPATYTAEWMSGEDVEAFFSADWDKVSLNYIYIRLYSDHVPLYFWLFRIVSFFFFKGSGSIWIGLSMNLLFYILFLGLVYSVFVRLTKSALASGVVTVLTCVVNRLMLGQATTLRMYMMLLLAEGLLLLAGLWLLQDIKRNKMSPGDFVCLFAISVFGFLTHYYFWIFYAVTAMLFCLWLLFVAFRKQGKKLYLSREFRYVMAWGFNFVASLLVTIFVFPYCRWNLNRGKGEMALDSIFVFSAEKVTHITWGYKRLAASVFGEAVPTWIGLGIILLCIVGGAWILYKRKEIEKMIGLLLVVLICQGYQLIVCFTLPDAQEERYLWGVFTFMLLCVAWGAVLLMQSLFAQIADVKLRKICSVIVSVVLTLGILIGEGAVIDGGNGVTYLFHPDKDVQALEEHSEIPWIVYGPTVGVYSYYDWLMPSQICFLSQEHTAEEAAAVRELTEQERFVLYTYADYCEEAVSFFEQQLGKELAAQYLTTSTNLTVYVISAADK